MESTGEAVKVFISSVIRDYKHYRDAAAKAIRLLGHEPIRMDKAFADPSAPRSACLSAVQDSDLVIALLGEVYGGIHQSGKSATHEELDYARKIGKRVLVFVEKVIYRNDRQVNLIRELGGWEDGYLYAAFANPNELEEAIIRALHEETIRVLTAVGITSTTTTSVQGLSSTPDSASRTGGGDPRSGDTSSRDEDFFPWLGKISAPSDFGVWTQILQQDELTGVTVVLNTLAASDWTDHEIAVDQAPVLWWAAYGGWGDRVGLDAGIFLHESIQDDADVMLKFESDEVSPSDASFEVTNWTVDETQQTIKPLNVIGFIVQALMSHSLRMRIRSEGMVPLDARFQFSDFSPLIDGLSKCGFSEDTLEGFRQIASNSDKR